MAGEFLVAGKLFKRQLQVSLTLGNAKSIDLFVHNPKTDRTFNVQVKTSRFKNCFPIKKERINENDIYVFVFLNDIDKNEDYFIVQGKVLLDDVEHFFGLSHKKSMPAINYGPLKEYKDNWGIFD